ncbi:MAG: hypothetical protein KTR31_24675 [Myxococcales bacterium]|nr:hypothetical protein [Myxococcales bacterium]
MNTELATQIATHPNWQWREGMSDHKKRRVVELDLWDGTDAIPDLGDFATAGAMLALLFETGRLTDVVVQDGEWIVAVEVPGEGVQGWAADTFGEAVAYGLLVAWGSLVATEEAEA